MKNNLFHTPEGVRDIYTEECARKTEVQNKIHKVFNLYGYKDIQTPTFEFFDIFHKERGSVAAKDMFKFVDRDGNTLVLRPDMTPPIARCIAKYYNEEKMPVRLCYCGNTYTNNSSYQGRLKEITQTGAELVGDSSSDADAEMIALVIDCLLHTGLKEFQVELGQVDFFRGLLLAAGIEKEQEETLRELIENKNYFGVEEFLSQLHMEEHLKKIFLKLPDLFGGAEQLALAKSLAVNETCQKAIERLEKVYQILDYYGFQNYVSFDLGMLSTYKYYTGIIFKGYTYGTGDMIVTGGRYDKLMNQFGKDAAAVGFAIAVDQLMLALSRQKIEVSIDLVNTMILYHSNSQKIAVPLANHFRNSGLSIQLHRKSLHKSLDEYIAFAKREHIEGILYIDQTGEEIQVWNLAEKTSQSVKLQDLMKEVSS